MPEEKPLNLKAIRDAFAALKDRVVKLEEKVRDQEAEAKARTEYIRKCQAKIDRYSLELDDALPRLIAAEAQLGRANAAHDKLWGLLGQTNEGITALRELVRDTLEKQEEDGK